MIKEKILRCTGSQINKRSSIRKCKKFIERFILYSGKDEFLTKVNIAQMGAEVANQLRGRTWDDRTSWINKMKDVGNLQFKSEKYDEAIETYMKALCGMDFSQYQPLEDAKADKERELNVKRNLKAPILNNIAQCLIKQGKLQRASAMLDQVIEVDPTNIKAFLRKI